MGRFKPQDHFFHKAKKEGYAARSAFKLEEIDKAHKLLNPGQNVLDLGCSPGSWSQYALKKVGSSGAVVGIDLNPVQISKPPNFTFIQADINEYDLSQLGLEFSLVLSDMAPKTSGIRITDQSRSFDLCQMALLAAQKFLMPNGHLIMKVFDGPDVDQLLQSCRESFKKVTTSKPDAVRKGSFERYIICLNKLR